jgi:hypothetical protein
MSQYVLLRIQSLQEELESLKKIVSHQLLQSQRKTTYIKGLWKDFEINDDDFADARSAVLKMQIICGVKSNDSSDRNECSRLNSAIS